MRTIACYQVYILGAGHCLYLSSKLHLKTQTENQYLTTDSAREAQIEHNLIDTVHLVFRHAASRGRRLTTCRHKVVATTSSASTLDETAC